MHASHFDVADHLVQHDFPRIIDSALVEFIEDVSSVPRWVLVRGICCLVEHVN